MTSNRKCVGWIILAVALAACYYRSLCGHINDVKGRFCALPPLRPRPAQRSLAGVPAVPAAPLRGALGAGGGRRGTRNLLTN